MAINRDKVLREAEKLVQRGKVEQAISEYEKVLKANPNDATTINRVGDLYGRIGQVERAVELYERIADHFTEDGFTTKAIAILKKINRLAPQRLDIFDRLAELYLQQGLRIEAKNQYQMLADWYGRNDDLENAIRVHRKLVELDPGNHVAHLRLADHLLQHGQQAEALSVYDRLGRMLLERDRLDEAERLYRHVLEQKPEQADFLVPMVEALIRANRAETARELVDAGLALAPASRPLQLARTKLAEPQDALESLRALHAGDPDNPRVQLLLGRALAAAGKAAEARDLLVRVVDGEVDRGRPGEAQAVAQEMLDGLPHDLPLLRTAVRAFELGGDPAALQAVRAELAPALLAGGDRAGALRMYSALAEAEPTNDEYRKRLAELGGGPSGVAAQPEPAPTSSAAVEMPPAPRPRREPEPEAATAPPFDPGERLAEAAVFAKYGLVEKAVNHLRTLLLAVPDMHEARERLVRLYVDEGQTEQAREAAQPLLEHLRASGDHAGLNELQQLVGTAAAPPALREVPAPAPAQPPVAPVVDLGEDEEIVIDLDAELEAELDAGGEDGAASADEPPTLEAPEEAPAPAFEATEEAPPSFEAAPEAAASLQEEPAEGFDVAAQDDRGFDFVPAGEPAEFDFAAPADAAEAAEPVIDFDAPVEAADAPGDADAGEEVLFGEAEPPDGGFVVEGFQGEPADDLQFEPAEPPRPRPAAPRFDAVHAGLDELEQAVRRSARPPAPAPAPAAEEPAISFEPPAVEAPAPAASDDELVEITGAVAGPPVDQLEQLDFFVAQELYEDALRILGRLEAEFPEAEEVTERRLLLKAKGVLLEDVALADGEAPEDLFAEEDEYVDLAKELEAELAEEEAMVEEATGRGKDEALLEEVFREFQKGVAEQLSEEDADTHFNLGIAYKEMGLLPEAIGEFQISARDAGYSLESCSMIAICYLEQGMPEQAVHWYRRALQAPDLGPDARLALEYDLATALESCGDAGEAVAIFEEVAARSPGYRDVQVRLGELERQRQAQ